MFLFQKLGLFFKRKKTFGRDNIAVRDCDITIYTLVLTLFLFSNYFSNFFFNKIKYVQN